MLCPRPATGYLDIERILPYGRAKNRQSHATYQHKDAGNNMSVKGMMDTEGGEFRRSVDLVGENGADQI